jgi:hypothetical protein
MPGDSAAIEARGSCMARSRRTLTEDGERPTSAAEVAFHWDAAGDAGRALEASSRTAAAAEAVYSLRDARGHYERALRLWEPAPMPTTGCPSTGWGSFDSCRLPMAAPEG